MSNIGKLISEQVHAWSIQDEKARIDKESSVGWPVITISREFGARGRSLANVLGNRLGFKVWDKDLLTAISKEAGADERFLASLDERRRKLIEDTLYSTFMGAKHSNTHYFRSLVRVVETIGVHGKSIIIGRGSNYIIKSPMALRIRLVCPLKERISFMAEQLDISAEKAEKMIKSRDSDRDDFVNHHFKKDSENCLDYDLVLNTGNFSLDQLAELVITAYEKKIGKGVPLIEAQPVT